MGNQAPLAGMLDAGAETGLASIRESWLHSRAHNLTDTLQGQEQVNTLYSLHATTQTRQQKAPPSIIGEVNSTIRQNSVYDWFILDSEINHHTCLGSSPVVMSVGRNTDAVRFVRDLGSISREPSVRGHINEPFPLLPDGDECTP